MTLKSHDIMLNSRSISVLQNNPQAVHHVIENDFNLQVKIFQIADVQRQADVKPTQAISIPSNPTECCSCDAGAIGDVRVIQ